MATDFKAVVEGRRLRVHPGRRLSRTARPPYPRVCGLDQGSANAAANLPRFAPRLRNLGPGRGLPAKAVSEHLGHSSVVITLDLYSHVLPSMQDELVNIVANLLKRTPSVD